MKKRDIEKTMRKRKFFTEKRRLESQELQFFMMSADNRKLRVKHGAKLYDVLKDQEHVNSQPLSLIETAIPKQKSQAQLLNPADPNNNSKNNQSVAGVLLSDYVKDTRFNPLREISKERNIKEFFHQKYMLVNEYLKGDEDDEVKPVRSKVTTAISRSRDTIKRRNIKRAQSMAELQNKNGNSGNNTVMQNILRKTRADQFIEQIEKQVQSQVDKEWKRKYDAEEEQRKMKEQIQRITESQKRRIQMFVDPRSSRIRQNFQVLNHNLSEIKKFDPQMRYLESATQRTRVADEKQDINIRQTMDRIKSSQWQHRSNADILNEILKIGRN